MTKRPVGLTKNFVFLSMSFFGMTFSMTSSMIASWSVLCFTSSACCVETTIASMRTGRVVLVLDRDLGLAVGAEEVDLARSCGPAASCSRELVRVDDRRGHELRRLVARVAEHEALVAGALLLVEALALGHALRDVRALLLDGDEHGARVGVEAHVRARVADVS